MRVRGAGRRGFEDGKEGQGVRQGEGRGCACGDVHYSEDWRRDLPCAILPSACYGSGLLLLPLLWMSRR